MTNVAARLAALGEGDAVMLGGQTRRRLGPEFAPEDLGETELRNIDEPVRVFRLRPPRRGGERAGGSRSRPPRLTVRSGDHDAG